VSAAPGDPDSSFGASGKVVTAVGAGDDRGHAVALQSDGKVVVAGYSHNGSNKDFCVVRYLADGSLDETFGTDGKVTTDFGATNDEANGVAIQADGKIIVAGGALNGSSVSAFALARLNPDGTLDPDFGVSGTGKFTMAVGAASIETLARAVKIQPDGKIVVAGHTLGPGGNSYDFALLRLMQNGTLDSGFGTGGAVTTHMFTSDYGWDLELQLDGKIVVTGISSHGSLLVARYHIDGSIDMGFAPVGQSQYAYDSAIQADGKILVAGGTVSGSPDFRLTRYLPGGALDAGFGSGGVVTTGIGTAQDLAHRVEVQPDGRIVVAGYSLNANTGFNEFAVVRYQTDGSLDTTFKASGKVNTGFTGGNAFARGLAITPDGHILLAGYAHDGTKNNLALAQFIGTGSLSTTAPEQGAHTSDNTPEIRGTATAGFTVNVHIDGVVVGTTVADGSGEWSFTPAISLGDGVHTAAATETDGLGGISQPSNEVRFTVDTIAPLVPVIIGPVADTLVNTSWPVISGTAEAGGTVRVYVDDALAGTAVTADNGTWSVTVSSALANGLHAVRTESTDRAGNAGVSSVAFSFSTVEGLFGGPGTLDPSFGMGGKVVTAIGTGDDRGHAMALQSDGKVVVAGYTHNGSNKDFAVLRYLADGSLDLNFGSGGKITLDFGATNDEANGVAIQPDGRIIVVGNALNGSSVNVFALARLNPDGSLDTGFGLSGTGKLKLSVGTASAETLARAVKVQPDGKIVVAGHALATSTYDFAILRLLPDGTLDGGFGTGGAVTTHLFIGDYAWDVEFQADGKIVVSGISSHGSLLVTRYHIDGTQDTSFTPTSQSQHVYDTAIQADGKIVVAGATVADGGSQDFRLVRYLPTGALDPTFGNNGVVVTGIGTAQDLAYRVELQPDGRILAAGFSQNANTGFEDFAVVRYHTNGTLDSGFQGTGKVTAGFSGGSAIARGLTITPDGRILLVGYAHNGTKNNFAILRLHGTGNLSTTVPAHGSYTSNNRPEIRGTATSGFTVNIRVDGVVKGSTVTDENGVWSFTPSAPLADGLRSAAATETDGFGNTGPLSNVVSFTVDTVAPAVPVITTPVPDSVLNTSWPVIGGTAEAGATVRVYIDDVLVGAAIASTNGSWSITVNASLTNGPHSVRAESADIAGNAGTTSSAFNFSTAGGLFGGPGTLDASFGTGGKVTTAVGSGDDRGHAMALQPDGKVVVAGYSHNGSDNDFCIVRYNADGTLDAEFGNNGEVTTDFGNSNDIANDLAIQPNGKIIAVGGSINGSNFKYFALACYHSDGSLDTSFGLAGTGLVKTSIGSQASGVLTEARSVGIQSDGKIVVTGNAYIFDGDSVLLRYNSNGTLDTLFGEGGATVTNLFNQRSDYGEDLLIQPDGRIVVCAYSVNGLRLLARYNSDGSLDATFAGDGTVVDGSLALFGRCVALQSDGKIILAGSNAADIGSLDYQLVRYNSDGSLDATFGINGIVKTGIGTAGDVAYDVAVQPDGRIVAAGFSYNADTGFNDFAVVRYQTDGSLDTSFKSTGKVLGGFTSGNAEGRAMVIAPDGRILVAGYAHDGNKNNFALIKLFGTDQPPLVETGDANGIVRTGAVLNGTVNPNSLTTMAYFEYGTTTDYGSASTSVAVGNGYLSEPVGIIIGGLTDNTLYHYRLVATNAAGTSYGEDRTFTTAPNPPLAVTGSASNITATSATLIGVALPNGRETSVHFEYGLTSAYGSSTSPQVLPASHVLIDVFAQVSGLIPGSTYHYRLVAINGGSPIPINGEDRTFVAQSPPPIISLGAAIPLTTTGVTLSGTVNPINSPTEAYFDYGTDGVAFPSSVAAAPSPVGGDQNISVTANLLGLAQGVTYFYRMRAVNSGAGQSVSNIASFTLDRLSGLTQVFPGTTAEAQGFLVVNLAPSGILHGWRFVGEQQWRASGVPVSGLTSGDRKIEFRPVAGYIHPPVEFPVPIVSGGAATVLDRAYFETEDAGNGGLSVTLKPDSITAGPERAQWRLDGENDEAWRDSGAMLLGLPPGSYLIECKPVAGRATPPKANVQVGNGQTASPTITYFLAGTATGTLPSVLAYESVSTDETKPYAYVGQIRSQAGLGTGFAVKERVVATAAHVVWDEGTLSAAQGLQWLHQRHQGAYEPEPLAPRGFYLLDGYDAQRRAENTPGNFSPQSRNLDVAALFFHGDDASRLGYAARGGYAGFLASDLDDNEFLLSNANKMLVGYPVDGISAGSQGRMHATSPDNVLFTPLGIAANRTFLTTDIRSFGGASGGPICVQFEGGAYYPAAIYLGGTSQSLVRAIDSAVINLFDRAALSGIDGNAHTNGGATHSNAPSIANPSNPGTLTVTLQPAAAAAIGGWRLRPESGWRDSGNQKGGLGAGRYVVQYKAVPGYEVPGPQNVVIIGGDTTPHSFTYIPLPPEIAVSGNGLSIANGDETPSSLDHTDFGIVEIASGTRTRTYTIQNTGDGPLSVGVIAVGGTHPDDFTVSLQPGGSVAPGESTSFQVVFDPTADDTRYANLTFANGDSDENPYTFAIRGNAGEDHDNNGFSDAEEVDLGLLLLSPLILGNSANLDMSFLELGPGGSLVVLGLPTGLVFDPQSGRILGSISGTPGTFPIELQKLIGNEVVSSLALEMELAEPARLKLGTLSAFGATKVGKRSRPKTLSIGNIGGQPLSGLSTRSTGTASRDFVLTQPLTKTLDAGGTTTFTVTFKPRAKGSRRASITIFSNTTPETVPVSGRGK